MAGTEAQDKFRDNNGSVRCRTLWNQYSNLNPSSPLTETSIPPRLDLSGKHCCYSENTIAMTRAWTMPRNPGPHQRPYPLCSRYHPSYCLGTRPRENKRQQDCRYLSQRRYKITSRGLPSQLRLIQLYSKASQS